MKPNKILFVCVANVCRSPMAEWIMKDIIRRDGESDHNRTQVRSAGISAQDGCDASDQALMVMRARGIDISRHRARMVNSEILEWADLVLCMNQEQVVALKQSFPESQNKIHLLTQYCGDGGDIDDPSGKHTSVYEECANRLDSLIAALLEKI